MDELIKSYSSQIKELLKDEKNQQTLLIAGAVYMLSKTSKERNTIIAAVAAHALLPDKTDTK